MITIIFFTVLFSIFIPQNNSINCVAEVKGFETFGVPQVVQTPYRCSSNSDACAKVEGNFNGIDYLFKGCNNDYIRYIQTFDTFSNCTIDTCTNGRIRMDNNQNLITKHCCCATDICNNGNNLNISYFIMIIFIILSIIFQKYN
uniref:UPAR/Ly6 domain-containing protein n=1 Tax=Strongyloides stercoralis TaxID=6248 RepID=A0A0K0ELZ4_STRER